MVQQGGAAEKPADEDLDAILAELGGGAAPAAAAAQADPTAAPAPAADGALRDGVDAHMDEVQQLQPSNSIMRAYAFLAVNLVSASKLLHSWQQWVTSSSMQVPCQQQMQSQLGSQQTMQQRQQMTRLLRRVARYAHHFSPWF